MTIRTILDKKVLQQLKPEIIRTKGILNAKLVLWAVLCLLIGVLNVQSKITPPRLFLTILAFVELGFAIYGSIRSSRAYGKKAYEKIAGWLEEHHVDSMNFLLTLNGLEMVIFTEEKRRIKRYFYKEIGNIIENQDYILLIFKTNDIIMIPKESLNRDTLVELRGFLLRGNKLLKIAYSDAQEDMKTPMELSMVYMHLTENEEAISVTMDDDWMRYVDPVEQIEKKIDYQQIEEMEENEVQIILKGFGKTCLYVPKEQFEGEALIKFRRKMLDKNHYLRVRRSGNIL